MCGMFTPPTSTEYLQTFYSQSNKYSTFSHKHFGDMAQKTLTKPYTIAGKAMITYVQNCLVISINLDLSAYSNG